MDERILKKRRKRKIKNMKKIKYVLMLLVLFLLTMFLIFLMVNKYIISIVRVEGNSMQRTFYEGDQILIKKIGLNQNNIFRDDIVMFEGLDGITYIKRVIGVPGDIVEIINGKVFINGVQKIEDYIKGDKTEVYDQKKWFVKEEEYFVMGDNRYKNLSKDSRIFGNIKLDKIQGKYIMNISSER